MSLPKNSSCENCHKENGRKNETLSQVPLSQRTEIESQWFLLNEESVNFNICYCSEHLNNIINYPYSFFTLVLISIYFTESINNSTSFAFKSQRNQCQLVMTIFNKIIFLIASAVMENQYNFSVMYYVALNKVVFYQKNIKIFKKIYLFFEQLISIMTAFLLELQGCNILSRQIKQANENLIVFFPNWLAN